MTELRLDRLRVRIALAFALSWLVAIGLLLATALHEGHARREERLDTELGLRATLAYGLGYFDGQQNFRADILEREPWSDDPDFPLRVLGLSDAGQLPVLFGPPLPSALAQSLLEPVAQLEAGAVERWQGNLVDQRVYLVPLFADRGDQILGTALVTHERGSLLAEQWSYSGGLIAAALTLALLGLGLAWWLARMSLEPLERTLQGRARFIARAAHELRTPLATLRSVVDSTHAGDESPSQGLARVESITRDAARRVESLLWHARLTSGESELRREPTRIDLLIEAALEDFPDARFEGSAHTEAVDATLLEVALRNLLENAARHGDGHGGAGVRVELGAGYIEVSDGGPGFPEGFTLGSRAHAHPERGGVGLGLELAQAVADLHGGHLQLGRAEGGARLRLHFRAP